MTGNSSTFWEVVLKELLAVGGRATETAIGRTTVGAGTEGAEGLGTTFTEGAAETTVGRAGVASTFALPFAPTVDHAPTALTEGGVTPCQRI